MINDYMITQKMKDTAIKNMMEDYPEASTSSLYCTNYSYDKMEFDFVETMEYPKNKQIEHHVDIKMLRKGFDLLIEFGLKGEYKNENFLEGILSDEINTDASDSDALVQASIFGKILYG